MSKIPIHSPKGEVEGKTETQTEEEQKDKSMAETPIHSPEVEETNETQTSELKEKKKEVSKPKPISVESDESIEIKKVKRNQFTDDDIIKIISNQQMKNKKMKERENGLTKEEQSGKRLEMKMQESDDEFDDYDDEKIKSWSKKEMSVKEKKILKDYEFIKVNCM